ncbi:MAG TPA: amidohydrolase family protein [Candidatus Eisenbacteria bacterium]|nr:amidohydrolase family protein [Candidatus Eisenbacteria bacterium]
MDLKAIDVHHHYVPPEIIEEAKRHGATLDVEVSEDRAGRVALSFAGSSPHPLQPALTGVDERLEVMRAGRVALATLEANTNSLGYQLRGEQGESWCRLYNECASELVKKHAERFTGMAAVPMQDPPRAARVLEDAIVKLAFKGAFIGTNVNGRYYNSRDFDPFWAKAQELDVLVVMHPEHIAGAERMKEYGLNAVCGNPADSTLALGYLIYSGVFDRFPNLKLCALHGGGFFPYHLGRFDQEYATGRGARPAACAHPPSAYIKNLYFDSLVYHVDTLEYLKKKVGTERLLVGTDYPYTLGDWMAVDRVEALNCATGEKDAILHGNARNLLKLAAM